MKIILLIALLVYFNSTPSTRIRMPRSSEPGFTVVGLSTRTNNAVEVTPSGKIGRLWNLLLSNRLADRIPLRIDDKVIALLTDYASDEKGDYTYILGVRVSSADHVPEGMVARVVPKGEYALVLSEDGPPSRVVPEAWKQIWLMSPETLGGRRAFSADFEEYDEVALSRPSLRARIYLSIR